MGAVEVHLELEVAKRQGWLLPQEANETGHGALLRCAKRHRRRLDPVALRKARKGVVRDRVRVRIRVRVATGRGVLDASCVAGRVTVLC